MTKPRKLTLPQKWTLRGLADGELHSAYEARASLTTLRALQKRGLAKQRNERGGLFSPHTSIKWRITSEGLRLLDGREHNDMPEVK